MNILNPSSTPAVGIFAARGTGFLSDQIAGFEGVHAEGLFSYFKFIRDPSVASHCGVLFNLPKLVPVLGGPVYPQEQALEVDEEQPDGLVPGNPNDYQSPSERIVNLWDFRIFDDPDVVRWFYNKIKFIENEKGAGLQKYGYQDFMSYIPGMSLLQPKAWSLQSKDCSAMMAWLLGAGMFQDLHKGVSYFCDNGWQVNPYEFQGKANSAEKVFGDDPVNGVRAVLGYYQRVTA